MDEDDLNVCYEQLGFTEAPFRMTPDTDYFFPSPQHLQALEHLQFGIASGELTMLTGEVGVGKTLVCRYLLRHPPQGVRFAYLLNPDQSYADLLGSIYSDLTGQVHQDRSIGALQRSLSSLLLQLAGQGERVAVLVDEAHRLSGKVLEGLRLLSNLDTEKEKLMCLVLVGQPELERTLSHRALRPLAQRISTRFRLEPFDCWETMDYIRHRLMVTGAGTRFQFSPRVLMLTHYLSGGVPRRINQLCQRALFAAYAGGRFKVSARMVLRAKREITGLT
ncbi:MAG: AAA family ATPase [Nitrospira sp. SB0666_bin_27]|nr:AAA family ATPase [Nitrospira sp. SB0666_bin_27]MYC27536.1 AAA family ATPase [Nitrospira sp. SB0662_bin_26]MYF25321.1 AAA family ATPase [Nitrospira sp. SB0678_bin_10]